MIVIFNYLFLRHDLVFLGFTDALALAVKLVEDYWHVQKNHKKDNKHKRLELEALPECLHVFVVNTNFNEVPQSFEKDDN